ncbi:hypothetical protein PVAG01_06570 [Phlyctema vagabunda]|uniref:Uncharacterized protein n=1 Tax=Phlyctema vagabunda TaxID=108571 RepID=A0ABR4PGJ6_9HELO
MASDADYAAFLDKANQDPNEGVAAPRESKAGQGKLKTQDEGVRVPEVLSRLEAYYVSDADEEFVPVGLKIAGSAKRLPDEASFRKMINHPDEEAQIEILDIVEWDPQGQYKSVVDAVREAGKGADVRVYKVVRDKTRVEYWVLTILGDEVVGVKALAVES